MESQTLSNVKAFLETTSVKGVPKIMKSSSTALRVLWITSLFFGVSVSTYFLQRLFVDYFSYGSGLRPAHKKMSANDYPAITICNLNSLANTPYDADGINQRIAYVNSLNQYISENLGEGSSFFDIFPATHPGAFLEYLATYLPENGWNKTRDFLVYCTWRADDRTHDCLSTNISLYTTSYGYCFTFRPPEDTTRVKRFSAILHLDTQSYAITFPRYPENEFSNGARVMLHRQNSLPVFEEGMDIEAGYHTTLSVNVNRFMGRDHPYGDCEPNSHLDQCWKEVDLGTLSYYNKWICEQLCFQRKLVDSCNCVSGATISLPVMRKDVRFCNDFKYLNEQDVLIAWDAIAERKKCYDNITMPTCPVSCSEESYDVRLSRTAWPHTSYQLAFYDEYIKGKPYNNNFLLYDNITDLAKNNTQEALKQLAAIPLIRQEFLRIDVVWLKDYSTTVTQVPSMELEGLIGTLGGVLNLWIGISFITVIEIIELVMKMVLKPEKKASVGSAPS